MLDAYDVYLVLQPFRHRSDWLCNALGPIATIDRAYLPGVEIFYRLDTDTALLALHFSPLALAHLGEEALQQLAGLGNLPVIIPDALAPPQRQLFFDEQLAHCDIHVAPTAQSDIVEGVEGADGAEPDSLVGRAVHILQERTAHGANSHLEDLGCDPVLALSFATTAAAGVDSADPADGNLLPMLQAGWMNADTAELAALPDRD